MLEQVRILRLVVVSPNDVQAERETVPRVIEELNRGVAAYRGLRFEVRRWETHTYPGFDQAGPQGLIDPLLRIPDCDVVVAIFWKRFGTLTSEGTTGTQHEFHEAYQTWRQKKQPQIMVYFNQSPYIPDSDEEKAQWKAVVAFREAFPKEGLWWPYGGAAEFEALLRQHLTNFLNDRFPLAPTARPKNRRMIWASTAAVIVISLLCAAWVFFRPRPSLHETTVAVLADFTNDTGDTGLDGPPLQTALRVQLEQTPFLKLLSIPAIQETLLLMNRSATDRLTQPVAQEICQRTQSSLVIAASISNLGNKYALILHSTDCGGTWERSVQAIATSKEDILKALDEAAVDLRRKLGESAESIRQFDVRLDKASTSSLEALRVYTAARQADGNNGSDTAIQFYEQAIKLDPQFALAYAGLGAAYSNLEEFSKSRESIKQAYNLSDRVSPRERLRIEGEYYTEVTGDLEKAFDAYRKWARMYERDGVPFHYLSLLHAWQGQYSDAANNARKAIGVERFLGAAYGHLANVELALNQPDEAQKVIDEATSKKIDRRLLHFDAYGIAFLKNDSVAMEQALKRALELYGGEPGEDWFFSIRSDTSAFYGHLNDARSSSQQAVESAMRNSLREAAAKRTLTAALREAEFGNVEQARQLIRESLGIAPAPSPNIQVLTALALARSGDSAAAQDILDKLSAQINGQEQIIMRSYWIPTVQAAIELDHGNYERALEVLKPAATFELGMPDPFDNGTLYPVFLRGLAYLQAGKDQAAIEFQKIVDHPGILHNFHLGALARLYLARAHKARHDLSSAAQNYREFLRLWKDADPDIPILRKAKAEFAELPVS